MTRLAVLAVLCACGGQPPGPAAPSPRRAVPAPEPAPALSELAEGFRRHHAGVLELVGSREATLTLTGWRPLPFEIIAARVLRPGEVRVWSSYERVRPEGEAETVRLGVWIDARPAGAPRVVSAARDVITRASVGDIVEIPVPLADPWGERTAFAWGAPETAEATEREEGGPDCSADRADEVARLASLAPTLVRARAVCGTALLASLRERQTVAFVVEAGAPGALDRPPIRVLGAGAPLVNGSMGVEGVTIPLRPGDRLVLDAPP